jgi:signal transduction histidine kinase
MKHRFLTFLRLIFLFFYASLSAQEASHLPRFSFTFEEKTNEDSVNIHAFAGEIYDSTHRLTIGQIMAQPSTVAWQNNPPTSNHHNYYWTYFRLINHSKDTVRRFIWTVYSFDYMKLYKISQNMLVDSIIRGRFSPLNMKYAINHQRTFYIELPPYSETDYYFNYYFEIKRGLIDSALLFNSSKLNVAHQQHLEKEAYDINWDNFLFTFLGILIFMTVIQYYSFVHNTAFLFYLGYLLFVGFYFFNQNNIHYRLYPTLDFMRPHFYLIEIIASNGCYAFYNLFIIKFSEVGKNYPPLIKISRFFTVLWIILIPIHCLITHYVSVSASNNLFVIVRIMALISSIITFLLFIKYAKSSLNIFIYLGSACLIFFVLRGSIETITEMLNFYPHNWLNDLDENYRFVGIKLGIILESIFFSIGLIFKGKQLAKEQRIKELSLQKQYIEQLESTQNWQHKYQTELEQDIATKVEQLASLEKEKAIERTRSQIAQDIHDEVGSSFTKISLAAELAARQPNMSAADAKMRFEYLGENARDAAGHLREIIFAINPDYDNFSEMQAYFMDFAHNFWQNTTITPIFDFEKNEKNPTIRPDVKRELLLVFKEAQNNIAKHTKASTVHLTLKIIENDSFFMEIKDNGNGFDPLSIEAKNGMSKGISGMRKRAESIHAHFEIESKPNQGTSVQLKGKF